MTSVSTSLGRSATLSCKVSTSDPGAVYMLTAYAKADRDDLTSADRRALARLVAEIERERQRR